MTKLDMRVRLIGRLMSRVSLAAMDDRGIARAQLPLARNPVLDQLLGKAVTGVEIQEGTAAGDGAPVRMRVYRPANAGQRPLPLIINIHGGGWTVGSLGQCDWLCSNIAARVGAVVVSIDYRKGPGTSLARSCRRLLCGAGRHRRAGGGAAHRPTRGQRHG